MRSQDQVVRHHVGSTIRAELSRRGLTQADVANRLGVTQQSVSARLCGRTRITTDELFAIADLLGVTVGTLTAGAERESAGGAA